MSDTDVPGRKVLRQEGDVQMWQEYIDGPHKDTGQLLRYFVGKSTGPARSFNTPHHAWDHFRKLTGIAETRPEASSAARRRSDER
jgi:hypothetical protein